MAENKKSFVLYSDLIHTIEKLTDDKAGLLFKHILNYVNDKNPVTDDIIIEIAFEPIKQQLKRDLLKWGEIRGKRSEAGKISAEKRKQQVSTNSTHVDFVQQTSTNSTVSVNVNDNVNVNVIKEKKKLNPSLEDCKSYFKENQYTEESAIKFFNYYDIADWKDGKGNKVKNWKQKAQAVWFKDENKITTKTTKYNPRCIIQ